MVSDRLTFGERLRRHRERRGISLKAISETTKIAASLFAALERGDCSRWPAGLYSRAYVRAYAEAVGLNAEDTVEDFATVFSGKVNPDGVDSAPVRSRRGSGTLRLAIQEEPVIVPVQALSRAAAAGGDLLVAFAFAWGVHAVLDPGMWLTLASGLAYHGVGRVISDEPLVCWFYRRMRAATPPEEPQPEEVPVGTAARTTA